MPVHIGQKPGSHFSSPLTLLTDCHRRIERFLDVLITVSAESPEQPLSDKYRQSFETALQYFREAAPNHTADEERSLFPRLRKHGSPELQAAFERIDALEDEHRTADQAHAEVDELGRKWLTENKLSRTEHARLRELLQQLSAMYRRHIAFEDNELFPLATKVLATDEQVEVGREMANRRGLRIEI